MIYLDYAATTPVDELVIEKMMGYLGKDGMFANPAARSHMLGWQAEAAVESARKKLADVINCDVREVVWTSGATESNNLAIKGALEYLRERGDDRRRIITSQTEHKAVLDVFAYLEGFGYEVVYIKPHKDGKITRESLSEVIDSHTALVSIMHVNNETGVINPVQELAELTKRYGALFHSDCAQSAGKLPIDLSFWKADMISISGHKVYGPKGIGALYVRRSGDFEVRAQIHGGGHERKMRSGTLATHQIVGLAEALSLSREKMMTEQARLSELRSQFLTELEGLDLVVNGDTEDRVAGILNLTFPGVDGQMLLTALPNVAVSSGSACNSASMAPSHVLKAMGVTDAEALSALRFSFGRYTTEDQVSEAATQLKRALKRLV